ncbi:hypothetical protein HN51_059004 [Arachis hypogaea]|uniref:autophagy-related protein 2 n=2 Tax=Arachis TaxID=3817 RepID=UPI000DEDC61B|nr:autophagy-related protein 2 [Arachis hypogaea]XP_025682453.1 autophagy-related protein 2 [Arachis hypogaea]QHN82379.1 Autophagy-related protein [Arachis hypogaea]
MFPWNIAKSAEAMFSRWALKRVFKFFLKKKLGQFIHGDVDLDQLDVQLTQGTIQLTDLALNVDFINAKLGKTASLIVKEGSIGYLLVKMPWSGKGCEVEVNELELVVSPCTDVNSRGGDEACGSENNDNQHAKYSSTRSEHEMADDSLKSTTMDVHEGVKTIAKMIKWLLTSFHLKITNAIVAFEPYLGGVEPKSECHRTLVLRISEIECGTSLAEDADSKFDVLGISQLTNFVKFHGAVVEFLKIDREDNELSFQPVLGAGSGETILRPKQATCPIMTGRQYGFGGNVKLSIPWNNGSLDVRKLDADVYVDPVVLRFQPSTLKWLLYSWESFKNVGMTGKGSTNNNLRGSSQLNSTLSFHSADSGPIVNATTEMITDHGNLPADYTSLTQPESPTEDLLPAPRLISDWVPLSTRKNHKDGIQELDFGASVDQFFECFDGMRNSQSALGSSGMWNWTYSVFSAITAASTLASGSMHIPTEQQHVETNLRATFAGISVVLPFCDEEQEQFCDPKLDKLGRFKIDYLGATWNKIVLTLQVCPQGMTLNGTVNHAEIASFLNNGVDAKDQSALVQKLQVKVLDALPLSASYGLHSDSLIGPVATDFPFENEDFLMKVTLFRTFGITSCKFTMQSSSSDGCLTGQTSFSLILPPFIFWIIFPVINALVGLLTEIGKSLQLHDEGKGSVSNADKKCGSSLSDMEGGSGPCVTSFSSPSCLHGDISISNARVMLCFPVEGGEDHATFFSWAQFITLDFTSSPLNKGFPPDGTQTSNANSKKRFSSVAAQSLQLKFCDLDAYVITSSDDSVKISSYNAQHEKFSASRILSIACKRDYYSVVSVVWQAGQVTGPWIAKKARLFAHSELRGQDDISGGGYEFASASTVKDLEDWKSQTQEEMVLSSSFFMHVHMPKVVINVSDSQYKGIHHLLHQMLNALACATSQETKSEKESTVSQSSVVVECDSVEILISRDTTETVRSSMQSELPGMWHQFKLKVQRFELLSVTNTGGINNAGFFRLTHGEGKLFGFTTGVPDNEFLLLTCSNTSVKRGDGGGSNALSSRVSGSDIIYLSDPENFHNITSISVSCGTVIAVGGRLDWFHAISSFFKLHASNTKDVDATTISKEESYPSYSTSFVLSLIDIALSYEPYLKNLVVESDLPNSKFSFSSQDMAEQYVACLLAASSLTLSNSTLEDSVESVFQIRVQDLGLLLRLVSELNQFSGTYSVGHLQKSGYVKVAQEAFMEAILKTNCPSGLLWELELSKSHLCVETCHDTTATLIRLATQLQQLFAPDVEESLVHLQNRWENVQQAQHQDEFYDENKDFSCESMASTTQQLASKPFSKDGSGISGLMDEICEDAFQVNDTNTRKSNSFESGMPFDGSLIEIGQKSLDEPEVLYHELNLTESMPVIGPEGSHTSFLQEGCFPEIIESYILSDLCPLSELCVGIHSDEPSLQTLRDVEHRDIGKETGGWYGGNSFEVLENHISEESEQIGLIKASDHIMIPSIESSPHSEPCGRVVLKKIDIRWKMYGGLDWPDSGKSGQHSGRDTAILLELALSGMKFQYDAFPGGGLLVSKMSVSVQDFYLYDRGQDAPWKLVLGYYHSKGRPRESHSKAFKLELEAVRPDPLTPLEEYRLNVAALPLLVHLHQSQLDFLVNFFGGKASSNDQCPNNFQDLEGSKSLPERSNDLEHSSIAQEALLPYFQKLDIWPILIRVDYSPKHVDLAALRHGKYVELVNLVPWKGVELNLKHVHAAGIYGWGSVCETAVGEWLVDISQSQVHKILQGLPTVRSLIAVGTGAAKLVSSPVKNYKKERRVLKGLQRGTIAFLRSLSLEAVGLGVHLAAGAHDILHQAEILASKPSPVSLPPKDKLNTDVRSNQPKDAQEGIQQAYETLSDGLGKSAAVLVQNPLKKYQRGSGAGPALAAAVRAVPAAAIAPASACASAVHYALLGFRNSLDPERKRESMEKYCPTQPWDEE